MTTLTELPDLEAPHGADCSICHGDPDIKESRDQMARSWRELGYFHEFPFVLSVEQVAALLDMDKQSVKKLALWDGASFNLRPDGRLKKVPISDVIDYLAVQRKRSTQERKEKAQTLEAIKQHAIFKSA